MNKINPKYLINLKESDLDKPIYRYITFDHLCESLNNIIINGKSKLIWSLLLKKPLCWHKQDIFENLFSNLVIHDSLDKKEDILLMGFKHTFFVQCWSLRKECDLMWKVYAPGMQGVKIKTTIRKLYNSITNQTLLNIQKITKTKAEVFIGKVDYQTTKDLCESDLFDINKLVASYPTDKHEFVKTLFLKRKEFECENEIRIVLSTNIINQHEICANEIIIPFNDTNNADILNFNDVIDEIIFDPRIRKESYQSFEKVIKDLAFSGSIKHSDLYNFEIKDKKIGRYIISKKILGY